MANENSNILGTEPQLVITDWVGVSSNKQKAVAEKSLLKQQAVQTTGTNKQSELAPAPITARTNIDLPAELRQRESSAIAASGGLQIQDDPLTAAFNVLSQNKAASPAAPIISEQVPMTLQEQFEAKYGMTTREWEKQQKAKAKADADAELRKAQDARWQDELARREAAKVEAALKLDEIGRAEANKGIDEILDTGLAGAQLERAADSRTTTEAVIDTVKDVAGKGAVNTGQVAWGLGTGIIDGTVRTAQLLGEAELVKNNQNLTGFDIVGGDDLTVNKGLETLGKKTIGVSLAPKFGEAKDIIEEAVGSDASGASKKLADIAAKERSATVAAEYLQAVSKKGKLDFSDKAAAQTASFIQAIGDTVDNPIELQALVGETLVSSFVPGAVVAGRMRGLSAEFLASEAGKKQVAEMASSTGITVGALQEGLSNAIDAQERIDNMSDKELFGTVEAARLLEQGLTKEQARQTLRSRAFAESGVISALVSIVSTKATNTGKMEGTNYGTLDIGEAKGLVLEQAKGIATGTGKEFIQESLESGGGQVGQNSATAVTTNPDQELSSGVGDAAAKGGLAGGITAGTMSTAKDGLGIAAGTVAAVAKTVNSVVSGTAKAVTEKVEEDAFQRHAKANPELYNSLRNSIKTGDFTAAVNDATTPIDKIAAVLSPVVLQSDEARANNFKKVGDLARQFIRAAAAEGKADLAAHTAIVDNPDSTPEQIASAKTEIDFINNEYMGALLSYSDQVKVLESTTEKHDKDVVKNIITALNDVGTSGLDKGSLDELYRKLGSQAADLTEEDIQYLPLEEQEYVRTIGIAYGKDTAEVHGDLLQGRAGDGVNVESKIRSVYDKLKALVEATKSGNASYVKNAYSSLKQLNANNQKKIASLKEVNRRSERQTEFLANLLNEEKVFKKVMAAADRLTGRSTPVAAEAAPASTPVAPSAAPIPTTGTEPSASVSSDPVLSEPIVEAAKQGASVEKTKRAKEKGAVLSKEEREAAFDKEVASEDYVQYKTSDMAEELAAEGAYTLKDPVATNTINNLAKYFKEHVAGKFTTAAFKATLAEYKAGALAAVNGEPSPTTKMGKAGYRFGMTHSAARRVFGGVTMYLAKQGSKYDVKFKKNLTSFSKYPNLVSRIMNELYSDDEVNDHALLNRLGFTEEDDMESLFQVVKFLRNFEKQLNDTISLSHINDDGIEVTTDNRINQNPLAAYVEEMDGKIRINENVASAIGYAALQELLTNKSLTTTMNTNKVIKGILGDENKDEAPSASQIALLRNAGTPLTMVATSIGQTAMGMLGTTINHPKNKLVKNAAPTAFGQAAMAVLVKMGMFEYQTISAGDLIAVNGGNGISFNSTLNRKDPVYFVKVVKDPAEKSAYSKTMAVALAFDEAAETMEKLFGEDPDVVKPLVNSKPVKASSKITRNTKTMPESMIPNLQRQNEQPHVISKLGSLFNLLPESVQINLTTGNYGTKYEQSHISLKGEIDAAVEASERDIRDFNTLASRKLKRFYLATESYGNRRMGHKTRINPQQSKIHRWLVSNETWKQKVSMQDLGYFRHAVVLAFDGKIDVWQPAKVKAEFERIYAHPAVQAAVREIERMERGEQVDGQALLDLNAMKEFGGGKLHLVAGVVALNQYRKAKASGATEFESDLAIEVDGKTNGFAFSLIQYAGMTDEVFELLNRTGVLTGYNSLADYMGASNTDSYQLIAKTMGDIVDSYVDAGSEKFYSKEDMPAMNSLINREIWSHKKKLERGEKVTPVAKHVMSQLAGNKNKTIYALQGIVGSMVDNNGKVTKQGRDYAKPPLMTWNYNAGKYSISRGFADSAIEVIYKKLAELGHDEKAEAEYQAYKGRLEVIFGTKIIATRVEAIGFTFNEDEVAYFVELINSTYGTALNSAMTKAFPVLDAQRKTIRDITGNTLKVFSFIYTEMVKRELAKPENKHLSLPTENIKNAVLEQLKGLTPQIAGFNSTEGNWGEVTDNIARMKFTESVAEGETTLGRADSDNRYVEVTDNGVVTKVAKSRKSMLGLSDTRLEFKKGQELNVTTILGAESTPKSQMINPSLEAPLYVLGKLNTSFAPILVHNLDGAVINIMMGTMNGYNLNDAIMIHPNDAQDVITKMNEAFKQVNEQYSIPQAAINMATTFFKKVDEFTKDNPGFFDEVVWKTDDITFKGMDAINQMASETLEMARLYKDGRMRVIKAIHTWSQYSLPGAEYRAPVAAPVAQETTDTVETPVEAPSVSAAPENEDATAIPEYTYSGTNLAGKAVVDAYAAMRKGMPADKDQDTYYTSDDYFTTLKEFLTAANKLDFSRYGDDVVEFVESIKKDNSLFSLDTVAFDEAIKTINEVDAPVSKGLFDEASSIDDILNQEEPALVEEIIEVINEVVEEEMTPGEAVKAKKASESNLGSSAAPIGVFSSSQSQDFDLNSPDGVIQLMEDLHNNDIAPTTSEHLDFLKGVMRSLGQVMEPVKVLVAKGANITAGDYNSKTKQARIKLNAMPSAFRRGMSAAETYAHEMLHHFIEPFIDMNNRYTRNLQFLWKLAGEHIKPEDLIELAANGQKIINPTVEQKEDAQKMWDYIFRNTQMVKISRVNMITGLSEAFQKHNGFHEFLAHLGTNAQLKAAINNNAALTAAYKAGSRVTLEKSNAKSSFIIKGSEFFVDLLNALTDLFVMISDYYRRGEKGSTAHERAMWNMERMVTINQNHSMSLLGDFLNLEGLDKFAKSKLNQAVRSKGFVAAARALRNNKITQPVGSLMKAASHASRTNKQEISKAFDSMVRAIGASEDGITMHLVREFQGRNDKTRFVHTLRQVSQRFIDNMRNNARTNMKAFIEQDVFNGKLTEQDNRALYNGVLRIDLGYLTEVARYSIADVAKFVSSPSARKARMSAIKAEMKADFPTNYVYYYKHAKSLAQYMVTSKHNQYNSGNNAHVIAKMKGAGKAVKYEGNLTRAEALIDELATLQGLEVQSAADLQTLTDLFAANPEAMSNALLMQHKLVKHAFDTTFGGNKIQMKKGYVTDITHPKRSLVFAKAHELTALLASGLELVYDNPVPKDENDPNGEEMYVLVEPMGALVTLQAGAISMTSEKHSGTHLVGVRNANAGDNASLNDYIQGKYDFKDYEYNVNQAIAGQFIDDDKIVPDNVANPIYDEKGRITEYRYEMRHQTRIDALKLQPRFSDVAGATLAHTKDKINTKVINRIAVDAVKKDFDKYKNTKEIGEYVVVGPQSINPKHKEMWARLPYDLRQYALQVFGAGGMYIRERNLADLLGQRELRASGITEAIATRFNNKFTESMNKLAHNSKFRMYEDVMFEIVAMAKDIVVVKSGINAMLNITSNALLLTLKTGNILNTKYMAEGFRHTAEYMKLSHQVEQLALKLSMTTMTPAERTKTLSEKLRLEQIVQNNPIDFLIRQGVLQTVVEDLAEENELFSYSSELTDKLEKFTNKVPPILMDLAKIGLVTHDTKLYKFMFKAVQMGDFVARYALYEANKAKGMSDQANVDDIMETFVDYDYVTHPLIGYLNKIGVMVFTKYMIRMQKVLIKLAIEKPLSVLALAMGQGTFGDVADPYDIWISIQNFINRLSNPIGIVTGAFGDTVTMEAVM